MALNIFDDSESRKSVARTYRVEELQVTDTSAAYHIPVPKETTDGESLVYRQGLYTTGDQASEVSFVRSATLVEVEELRIPLACKRYDFFFAERVATEVDPKFWTGA